MGGGLAAGRLRLRVSKAVPAPARPPRRQLEEAGRAPPPSAGRGGCSGARGRRRPPAREGPLRRGRGSRNPRGGSASGSVRWPPPSHGGLSDPRRVGGTGLSRTPRERSQDTRASPSRVTRGRGRCGARLPRALRAAASASAFLRPSLSGVAAEGASSPAVGSARLRVRRTSPASIRRGFGRRRRVGPRAVGTLVGEGSPASQPSAAVPRDPRAEATRRTPAGLEPRGGGQPPAPLCSPRGEAGGAVGRGLPGGGRPSAPGPGGRSRAAPFPRREPLRGRSWEAWVRTVLSLPFRAVPGSCVARPLFLALFLSPPPQPIDRGLRGRLGEGPPRAGPQGSAFRRSGLLPASATPLPSRGARTRLRARLRSPPLRSAEAIRRPRALRRAGRSRPSPREARASPGARPFAGGFALPSPRRRLRRSPASPRVRFFFSGTPESDRPSEAPRRPREIVGKRARAPLPGATAASAAVPSPAPPRGGEGDPSEPTGRRSARAAPRSRLPRPPARLSSDRPGPDPPPGAGRGAPVGLPSSPVRSVGEGSPQRGAAAWPSPSAPSRLRRPAQLRRLPG